MNPNEPKKARARIMGSELASLLGQLDPDLAALLDQLARGGVEGVQLSGLGGRPPKQARPKCGATTRTGRPCQAPVVWLPGEDAPRGRCRMHGGLSTGPKTPEGRAAIAESNRRRAAQRRVARANEDG